jgi:hypothetical protein
MNALQVQLRAWCWPDPDDAAIWRSTGRAVSSRDPYRECTYGASQSNDTGRQTLEQTTLSHEIRRIGMVNAHSNPTLANAATVRNAARNAVVTSA